MLVYTELYQSILDISWIHQDTQLGSTKIHHCHPTESLTGIYHWGPPGSTTWIHMDPARSPTWIHQDPPHDSTGSTTWILLYLLIGSTRIHHVDLPGSIRIYCWGPPGPITGFHQDPQLGSQRKYQVYPPRVTT